MLFQHGIFTPVSTSAPGPQYDRVGSVIGLPTVIERGGPIQTNNFWGNLTLGSQDTFVYTHPYVVWVARGGELAGLCISHQQASQRVFGGTNTEGAASSFCSPSGTRCIVLGSPELDSDAGGVGVALSDLKKMSVSLKLLSPDSGSYMTCPLVQGMGFVTAVYHDLVPAVHSGIGIKALDKAASQSGINKYTITLANDLVWTMYVTGDSLPEFAAVKGSHIVGTERSNCTIQVARGDFSEYDQAAGCYPVGCTLAANTSGRYSFEYTTVGSSSSGTPLMYALPHHTESFTESMEVRRTSCLLDDTVHGTLRGYLTDLFEMQETLPDFDVHIQFEKTDDIIKSAAEEAALDVSSMSDLDSMYFSGKVLDKFSYVLYVVYMLGDTEATAGLLDKMKAAIERFSTNSQTNPLCYETNWRGLCSSAGLATGDLSQDCGNSFYYYHHAHYGYHIHAAALTAYVDQRLGGHWYKTVKEWVNLMIRDVANPSERDTYFPVFRSFDFFLGHSVAEGLVVHTPGKAAESSSEDYNFTYGMKVWAQVTGDRNMEARADLMLAISKRSINTYMLYGTSNNNASVIPTQFRGNCVGGVKRENGIEHTTHFGDKIEYVHGVHMVPVTPVSSYIREPEFVKEEWSRSELQSVAGGLSGLDSGWKSILYMNLAISDPATAYAWFVNQQCDAASLDSGMSKTWGLAYSKRRKA